MIYEDLIVLIPSHSLEDFPTELPEAQAASLLNSFVVPWHPLLIATAGVLPRWHRSDDPPEASDKRLFMLPTKCNSSVPSGWAERARREGAVVIADMTDREEMLAAALKPLTQAVTANSELAAANVETSAAGETPPVVPAATLGLSKLNPDLAKDFLALGFCYLQVELLTRHMRHFSNLDEVHLQKEVLAAAKAAIAGDDEAARTHLRGCFEVLTEARERFYPVDCYLIDLCLLIPRLADEHLERTLAELKPMNVLVTGQDLEEISREHPAVITKLREAWDRGSATPVGGEYREAPLPLLPLESVLWQLTAGREIFRKLLGRQPQVWGRRRYGLLPQLPQILQKFGYIGAMHVAMDDGLYPDSEHSKVRWEGTNGSVMDAISRIPLAAEGANSFIRFPVRMSESMDHDQVAAVMFARWPEVKSPWFDDLRRMHSYSPVLGRFVTLEDYFQNTDSPGRLSGYDINDYLSPFLVQAVAYQEPNPISRHSAHFQRRQQFDVATWLRSMRATLAGQPPDNAAMREMERAVEAAEAENDATKNAPTETRLEEFHAESARELASLVLAGGGSEPGYLLVNSLSFNRKVSVELPALLTSPAVEGAVQFVQWDATRKIVTAEIPGSGFVWIPLRSPAPPLKPVKSATVLMAEQNVLRNEFFEVHLNEQTGGIAKLKEYGRTPNRLSHQLAFRFPRERRVARSEEDFGEKTFYSQMRVSESLVTCSGPALGEIVTTGEIYDQVADKRLAGFKQTYRVWRGRPVLEVRIELDIEHMPDGDPWSNYYAVRFAWNDSAASLTRSVMLGAQGLNLKEERFESPHYLEIATDQQRTTILNMGLPFHRKTGDRMVDTLLVAAGETHREFRFVIAIDQNYPLQAALDALSPVLPVATTNGPPRVGRSGWFFHLNARNVQITRVLDRMGEPIEHEGPWERHDHEQPVTGKGCAVRLLETEGRPIRVQLRCYRTPLAARQRNFLGRTISELKIEGDAVTVDLTAFEIADIELTFEGISPSQD